MMIYFLGFYALAHYYVFPMEDLSSGPKVGVLAAVFLLRCVLLA